MAAEQLTREPFYERVCPICGTVFCYTTAGWAYKISTRKKGQLRTVYYCRYSCFLKGKEQLEPRKKKEDRSVKLDNRKLRELKSMMMSGMTRADCAREFHCAPSTITYYIDRNPELFEELNRP